MKNTFIYNNYLEAQKVLSTLEKELEQCDEFIFSVAFISESGLTSLLQVLEDLEKRNIPGKILSDEEIAQAVNDGKKAFGFVNTGAGRVLPVLVQAILKKEN